MTHCRKCINMYRVGQKKRNTVVYQPQSTSFCATNPKFGMHHNQSISEQHTKFEHHHVTHAHTPSVSKRELKISFAQTEKTRFASYLHPLFSNQVRRNCTSTFPDRQLNELLGNVSGETNRPIFIPQYRFKHKRRQSKKWCFVPA